MRGVSRRPFPRAILLAQIESFEYSLDQKNVHSVGDSSHVDSYGSHVVSLPTRDSAMNTYYMTILQDETNVSINIVYTRDRSMMASHVPLKAPK
jgi:hypothetical protein